MSNGKTENHKLVDDLLFNGILSYPQRTVAGMYKQEQELAKADEAGLIITAADLAEEKINVACIHCAYVEDNICDECEANE